MKSSDKIITSAIKIAKKDLHSCYTSKGILTGSRKVYWSWDSFFASLGALELGDFEIVKKNLSLYLKNQAPDGNIPKRIANPLYIFRFLGLPISEEEKKQKPNYKSPYYTGRSLSQGPVFIIAFYEYTVKSGDLSFLKKNFSHLEKLVHFLEKFTYKNGLLREAVGGGWAESVLKRGAITYTNMCWAEALNCMEKMALKISRKDRTKYFAKQKNKVKQAIDQSLWEDSGGGYYSDWLGFSRHHYFSADGNLLSIWRKIADKDKTAKINRLLNELLERSDLPIPLTINRYYFWRIYFANQIAGIKQYHIRFSWIWLGCLAALVKYQIGQKDSAKKIILKIAKVIVKDGAVQEIYHHSKPVRKILYKSEKPWAWSAGFFIYACAQIGCQVKK